MSFGRYQHTGNAVITTLASDITSSDTSASLVASTGWPDGSGYDGFWVVIDPGLSNEEKVLVTARSGLTLTGMSRGSDGPAASSHSAGATIEHIYSATEADDANNTSHQVLGQIATKGDLLVGKTAATLTPLTVGTDGLALVADSTQTSGLNYKALGTSGFADSSVTSAKIVDATIVNGDLAPATLLEDRFSAAFWHRQSFSVTSGSSGAVIIPHGASFVPTFVSLMFDHPTTTTTTADIATGWVVTSIDATNVTIRCSVDSGITVSGQILVLA